MIRYPIIPLVVIGLLAAACASDQPSIPDELGSQEQPTTPPSQTITIPEASTSSVPTGRGFAACAAAAVESPGQIQRADLKETSGLAVSQTHGDTVWAVNDSGNAAGVYAMSGSGADLGFFSLVDSSGAPVATTDPEDLGLHNGLLHLADIGDNNSVRDVVTIYLVPEPQPGGDGTAVVKQQVVVRYPTGPVDAEAFLVDPVTGQLVILDKELSTTVTTVFTVDPPFTEEPMEAVAAGMLDLGLLESTNSEFVAAALLFPAAVTAADITPDGNLIGLRTYGTVWLFPRGPGQSVAEALGGTPCEPGGGREGQGESLAFLGNPTAGQGGAPEVRFLTVSEGDFRPLNIATVNGG